MVSITPGVDNVLGPIKSVFSQRFKKEKICITTILVILLLLVAVNLIAVYRATIPHEFRFTELLPSSPISKLTLDQHYSKCALKGYSFTGKDDSCEELEISDGIWVSSRNQIEDDMKQIRNGIYKCIGDYPIAANFFLDDSTEKEEDILLNKWWRFGGSSVWLEKYQIHYMVSRIIYSLGMNKSKPKISFLRVQAFDKNWKELKKHTIEISQVDGSTSKIHFPDILKVPIDTPPKIESLYNGPEDPRILVRKYTNSKGELDLEPVIVFNMLSRSIGWKRGMHVFRPFDNNRLVLFKIKGSGPQRKEKNWVPFFNEEENENVDSINLIYNLDPLVILECSLADGLCEAVATPEQSSSEKGLREKKIGPLRGGTSMIPIPSDKLPDWLTANNKKYWLGFHRSHIDLCGCLKVLYRPHLMIMSREGSKGIFKTEYVSSLLDFNLNVAPWHASQSVCEGGRGKSVLIPNSISYWDFIENENGEIVEDFLDLTLSEADSNVEVVHIRGLWKHVLKVLSRRVGAIDLEKVDSGGVEKQSDVTVKEFENIQLNGRRLVSCAVDNAEYYCASKAIIDNWYT